MVRLPVTGQDENTWGDILNEFLEVEHNPNGTLKKAGAITTAQSTANDAQDAADAAQATADSAQTDATNALNTANSAQSDADTAQTTANNAQTAADNAQDTADTAQTTANTAQSDINTHEANTSNPHNVTKAQVGLSNVDDTSDANKPISSATQTALNLKAPTASPTFTGTVSGITKAMVGLDNVDNTSDATKNTAVATLTNKRITKRIQTLADSATVTPNSDDYDGGRVAELSQTTTITNPTGTPTEFQQYILRIKTTTSRSLAWGTQYRGSTDIALPSTTVGSSLTGYFGFMWNATDSKWDLVALSRGY